ncbi:unnamed protein product [Gulo gulo]|uniref:Uncharacterized protein n=1 Tax=Gulo gulo TaxID=48420 RepID=A0A9X9LV95_GULGU|nr:unnamed protein product [Gulo gulo]
MEPGSWKTQLETLLQIDNDLSVLPSLSLRFPFHSRPGCGTLLCHYFLHKICKTPASRTEDQKREPGWAESGGEAATPACLRAALPGEDGHSPLSPRSRPR